MPAKRAAAVNYVSSSASDDPDSGTLSAAAALSADMNQSARSRLHNKRLKLTHKHEQHITQTQNEITAFLSHLSEEHHRTSTQKLHTLRSLVAKRSQLESDIEEKLETLNRSLTDAAEILGVVLGARIGDVDKFLDGATADGSAGGGGGGGGHH